jgi:hypothetical protein
MRMRVPGSSRDADEKAALTLLDLEPFAFPDHPGVAFAPTRVRAGQSNSAPASPRTRRRRSRAG